MEQGGHPREAGAGAADTGVTIMGFQNTQYSDSEHTVQQSASVILVQMFYRLERILHILLIIVKSETAPCAMVRLRALSACQARYIGYTE